METVIGSYMEKAIILIKGIQTREPGNPDRIELETEGEYGLEDGKVIFRYQESEITGLAGTETTFTVDGDTVYLNREGTVCAQMVFCEGKKHYFAYETPYGVFTMGIDTYHMQSTLQEDGGSLEIQYLLDLDNNVLSRNVFQIHVRIA